MIKVVNNIKGLKMEVSNIHKLEYSFNTEELNLIMLYVSYQKGEEEGFQIKPYVKIFGSPEPIYYPLQYIDYDNQIKDYLFSKTESSNLRIPLAIRDNEIEMLLDIRMLTEVNNEGNLNVIIDGD